MQDTGKQVGRNHRTQGKQTHMKFGVEEFIHFGREIPACLFVLEQGLYLYWQNNAHIQEKNWHLIPNTGYEGTDIRESDIRSPSLIREIVDRY